MRQMSRLLPLAAAAAAALTLAACGDKKVEALPSDMTLGSDAAPVTVVEYASVTCPHCARFNQDVFPEFKKKYIDTGKVKYVFREFLTAPANVAAAGTLLARCSGKDKYFKVIDALMRSQADIEQAPDPQAGLLNIALSVGMSEKDFHACITDDKAYSELNARVEAGEKAGVTGTPSFWINGEKYKEGEVSLTQLDDKLAPLIAAKK